MPDSLLVGEPFLAMESALQAGWTLRISTHGNGQWMRYKVEFTDAQTAEPRSLLFMPAQLEGFWTAIRVPNDA